MVARGTLRFRRSSGHTLVATKARRRPDRMARTEVGSFAQGVRARGCVAIGRASEEQGHDLTLLRYTMAGLFRNDSLF
jgi:hypothetical protein